jgi:hemolysin activation/secretion protein
LGWDSGLRGYDAGAFTGNKLFRLSLEDRIFPRRNLFGLLALGVLPFWDCGYVWQEDQPVDLGDLRQDVGLGLRIALPRVAGSNVFQLTWGVPVGRGADLSDSILTFSTSTGF